MSDNYYAEVRVENTVNIKNVPEPPPPSATPKYEKLSSSALSGTTNVDYVVSNGQTLYVQRCFISSTTPSVFGGGVRLSLYDDVDGDGLNLVEIWVLNISGGNFNLDLPPSTTIDGDGTRRLRMTVEIVGGGSLSVFARWDGYEVAT